MFELNDETRFILGRPNFWCGPMAACLRTMGHGINERSEDEQAAVIHWMLTLYETHGASWREEASRLLREGKERQESKSGAEKASESPDPVYCSACGQEDRDCYCDPSTPPENGE